MIGAYGYDWNDAEAVAQRTGRECSTSQEIMKAARGPDQPRPRMDPVSLNPYMQLDERGLHRPRRSGISTRSPPTMR